jgi:hypothetical protein
MPGLLEAQGGYSRARRGGVRGAPANPAAYKDVAGSFHGKLKDLSSKEILIETDDKQIVSIRRSRKTKFLKGDQAIKASAIDIETPITIDASEDVDLTLTAITVIVDQPQKPTNGKQLSSPLAAGAPR